MAKQLNVNLAFSADTSKVKAQLQDLQNQLNKLTLSSKTELGITKDIEEASRAAAELSVHLKNATNQQTGTLDFSKLNQSIKQSGTSLQQYGRTLQSLGPQGQQAFMSLAQAVANSEVPIRRTNAMLKEMGTTLANTARWQLSSSMLHGFMGAVQSAYGYAQDLNESLNNIRIVTGQNIDQMAKFAEKANKAARALSTTTTEYTNASLIYYQQGLNDQQVKERTDITIKMANVARQSAEVVSDQMTAVWNNFYDGSKSLEHYADVMTALGAATASSTDEIAEGLNKFAAVADTVGLSYEYAASALATVTATTRQSADVVGTAFKTLFARIQDLELGKTLDDGTTLGSYSQALAKVGVQIKDTSGEMKSMDTILEEMAAKWDTLGKAEQIALAQSVAGVRQYTQLIALMDNWDFMEKNLATSNTSSGALQKQADTYAESWEAARDRVRAAAEGVYKSLINDEFFIDVLNNIEKIISFVDHLIDNLGGLKGVLMAVGAIATKVFSAQLSQGLTNMVYNIRMMTKAGREAEQNARKKIIDDAIEGIPQSKEYSSEAEKAEKESMRSQLTLQQEMMANADRMNAMEQARNQMLLDRNKVLQEQAILAAKAEDAAIQQKGQAVDAVQTRVAANFGNDQQFQLEILRKITAETGKMKESFRSHSEIDALFTAFKQGGEASKESVKQLQNQIIELKSGNPAVQALINAMKDYDLTVDNVEENITTLKAQIKALVTDSAATLKADIIPEEQMQEGSAEIDRLVASIEKQIEAEIRRKNAVENGAKSHKAAAQAIKESTGNQKQWADIIVESANFAFSAASALQMLGGAFEQLRDPDVSGWQKFLTVLTTLGMIVPTVISLFSTLKKLLSAETVAKLANVAASLAQAAAERQVAKAKGESSTATKQNTSETNKNTASKVVNKVADSGKGGKSSGKFGNLKNAWNQGALDKDKRFTKLDDGRYRFKGSKQTFSADVAGKKAGGDLLAKVKNVGAGFALITAGVMVAVGAVKWGIAQFNKYSDAAKEAAKQAQEAATAYQAVSDSYNTFTSNLSAYQDAQSGLKDMTKGTLEYREAVLKANESAMQLLDTYEDLEYTVDADGLIIINETSLEQAREKQLELLENAQRAKQLADQNAKNKELKAESVEFQREELNSSQGTLLQVGNAAAATAVGTGSGALIGAGIGMLGGPIGAAIGAGIGAIAGAITGVVGSVTAGAAANEEEEAINRLAEVYSTAGNAQFATDEAFEKLLREDLKLDDEALIKSLVDNRESTLELVKEVSANTEAINAQNAAVVQNYFKDQLSKSGLSEEQQAAIASRSGALLDEKTEELYESTYKDKGWLGGGMTDEEVQKAYAEAMGWATDTIDNQNGNKAKYFNKDGTEVGVISDEVARRYLAEQEALKALEKTTKALTSKFKELENSSDKYDKALLSYMENKDFSDLTEEEYNSLYGLIAGKDGSLSKEDVQQYINDEFNGGYDLTDSTAQQYGYDTAEQFYNDFFDKLNLYEEHRNSANNNIANYAKNLINNSSVTSTMSTKELEMMGKQVNQALINSGENAAQYVANTFYKKAEGEAEKVAKALDTVDWSTVDAETLSKTLAEAGVATSYTTDELNTLIDYMVKDASSSIEDVQNKLKVLDEINNLTQGSTISSDQYSALNDELQSYFTLMADGTYKLTQNALDFYQAVNQEQKKLLTNEIELMEVEFGIANDIAAKGREDYFKDLVSKDKRWQEGVPEINEVNYQKYLDEAIGATGLMYRVGVGSGAEANGMAGSGLNYNTRSTTETLTLKTPDGTQTIDVGTVVHDTSNAGFGDDGRGTIKITRPKRDENSKIKTTVAGGYESVDYETVSVNLSSYEAWSQDMQIKRAKNKANTKTTADQNKIIADQLLLLEQSTNKETLTLVENWKTALSNGTLSLQQAEDIYKKVAAEGEEIYTRMKAQAKETERQLQIYKNTLALQAQSAQERDDLLGQGTINEQAYWLAVSSAHDQELMENLDVQAVNKYAEHLENAAYASDLLFDNMSKETMEDVAAYTMKMNRGIETLSSNFENWNDILRNSNASSVEFAESLSGMKAAMSDVLGVSEEFLSDNFMLSELEDIELAAQGDADAINRLAMAASRDILFNIGLSSGKELQAEILQIHDDLMLNMPDVEVGASLRHADFQKILDTAQMTVEEAQAYFNALGYEPTFVTVEEEVPLQGTRTYTTNVVTNKTSGGFEYIESSDTVTEPVDMDKTQKVQIPVLSGDGVPTLKHITKKSDGAMNNSSSANAGGSGAKKAKPIKQTKNTDIVDRYKEVTDAIDDVENALNDASKAADRLYGAARLKQLEKQKKLIEDEVKLLKQKKAEAQANLLLDRQALSDAAKSAGVSFDIDEKGNITNYTEKMNALFNELTERENKANEITNQEQQDKYIEKYVEPLRNIIQQLKEAMSQYEETRELLEDVDDLIDDKWDAWQDTNYEELHYKLELQLEINDRDLQEIDYYLNKIQNDFYKMAEGAAYFFDKFKVYQNGSSSDETFLNELTEKYNSFNKDGIRNISNEDYFKGLQEVFDNALSNAQAIKELDDTMLDYYGNTLAAAGEELVKYTDRMEHQTAALEHYKNIMSIIGKSTDYKSMGVILENQAKTIENELAVIKGNYEMLAGEADYWKQMMESVDETDPAFAVYKANWEAAESATRDAQANMLSKTEEWAEAMKAIMENKLSDLAQTLENNLTGGTSFETISSQIERASSLQEEYLTTTNKIYETNKMINTAQQAIDKTSNTIAKQKLKSFQQETAQLQNKKKLSQYELEIQQAKYDLLLAEIALEEAQQAKSTVRLQRDSEGNFGYVYTADATQISEAEQKLADAQNNLYNIGLEGANNYTQKYQETMQEMYDTLTELQIQYLNGEFETEEEYHNAVEEAKAYYYQKLSDYSHLYQEAVAADSRVIADAWSSDFADMTYNTENWKSNVENYLNDIDLAFDGWEKTVDRIKNETVGNDLDELKTKVGNIVTESNKLAEAITKKDGVLDGLKNMINKVGDATLKWGEQRGVVLDLIEYYENLANEAKKAQDAIRWDEGNNTPTPNPVPPEVPGSVGGDGNLNEVGVKPESEPSTKPTNPSETFDPNTLPAGLRTTVTLYSSPSYGGGMGEHPIWAGYFSLEKSGYGTGKPGSAYSGYYLKNEYGLSGYISNLEAKRLVDEKYIRNTNFTFDTGGYTGQWGQSGKWALLHEKELVLNADDTTNFLASLEVLREIVNTINLHSMNAQLGGLLSSPYWIDSNRPQTLEQQVHIEANFPNVSDRNEIEEAFNNLVSKASQYVNRK